MTPMGRIKKSALVIFIATWPVLLGLLILGMVVLLSGGSWGGRVDTAYFSALCGAIPIFFAVLLAAAVYTPPLLTRNEYEQFTSPEFQLSYPTSDVSDDPEERKIRLIAALERHGLATDDESTSAYLAATDFPLTLYTLEESPPGDPLAAVRAANVTALSTTARMMGLIPETIRRLLIPLRWMIASALAWSIMALIQSLVAVATDERSAVVAAVLGGVACSQLVALLFSVSIDAIKVWARRFDEQRAQLQELSERMAATAP
jgi:hypothetical protein